MANRELIVLHQRQMYS